MFVTCPLVSFSGRGCCWLRTVVWLFFIVAFLLLIWLFVGGGFVLLCGFWSWSAVFDVGVGLVCGCMFLVLLFGCLLFSYCYVAVCCRSYWPRCLRRWCAAARLLGLRVRVSPGAWMSLSCGCCVLSGRGLCVGPITRTVESYRLWCVWVSSWSLDIEEALAHCGLLHHGKKEMWLLLLVSYCCVVAAGFVLMCSCLLSVSCCYVVVVVIGFVLGVVWFDTDCMCALYLKSLLCC